ncbi:MAG: phosphoenolpyruvate synthase, partial [Bradyrhizobiaceae bacterium]|nr:phosphoenolpyruvate synthase [Bradyrhizobiaceae bacterium]
TDHDMLDMTPGEILVTTNTTPSLMLAVEKAAGIVTDEGGMLCHAAIVSREFDIPCVIGTEDSTCRLRTGDTIDMSADEGRIKIVRRAQLSVKP